MRSPFIRFAFAVGLFTFAPAFGCSNASDVAEQENGISEDAASASSDHAAEIARCRSAYEAEPGWRAEEAIDAAERFHGCLFDANDAAVAIMARRTGSSAFQAAIETYRNSSNAVCAAFFGLDGPVVIDTCVARREELLAQLIGAYGDLGESPVPIVVADNVYARCSVEGVVDFRCVDAQARQDATAVVSFRAEDAFAPLQRDARVAKDTCHLLALRARVAGRSAPPDAKVSNACTVDHLGLTATIGRTTRP